MMHNNYRLNVRYMPMAMVAARRGVRRLPLYPYQGPTARSAIVKSGGAALRGILIGVPIAAVLWAPIVWALSRLL